MARRGSRVSPRATTPLRTRHAVLLGSTPSLAFSLPRPSLRCRPPEISVKSPSSAARLDLRAKLVTADAMRCQKAIAQTIVGGGGDYILSVTANQPTLHAEIHAVFAQAPPPRSAREYSTTETGHGRHEHRAVRVLPARGHLSAAQAAAWPGVLSVVRVTRVVWCQATGVGSTEVSYFSGVCALTPGALGVRFAGTGV